VLDRAAAILLACLIAGLGCANLAFTPTQRFDYFAASSHDDPWRAKIVGWQRRERADQGDALGRLPAVGEAGDLGGGVRGGSVRQSGEAGTAGPAGDTAAAASGTSLRSEYASFLIQRKRATARDFAAWVQSQAKLHYVADGAVDHWATLEETLREDGDDCDGLELLAFHGLRELGFDASKVFRSIVYRPSDGQHHMVTLWFEDPDDPWVIDPTGAMTTGMPRMSQLPEWVPLRVFSDTRRFTVVGTPRQGR